MIQLKAHIARLFSLLVVLLITSNIGFSAVEFNPFKAKSFPQQVLNLKDKVVFQKTDDSVNNQLFAFEKDQQELELELDLFLDEVFFATVFYYLVFKTEKQKSFSFDLPLLKSIPLWITNLQIRL